MYCFFFGHRFTVKEDQPEWFGAHCPHCNRYEVKHKMFLLYQKSRQPETIQPVPFPTVLNDPENGKFTVK